MQKTESYKILNNNISSSSKREERKVDKVFYLEAKHINDVGMLYEKFGICEPEKRYCLLVRVFSLVSDYDDEYFKYDSHNISSVTYWKVIGNQIYFSYKDANYLYLKVKVLEESIRKKLEHTLEVYNVKPGNMLGLQYIITQVNYNDIVIKEKKLDLVSDYHSDLINKSNINTNINILPLTCNINNFGVLLNKVVNKGYVDSINLLDGTPINIAGMVKEFSNSFNGFTEDVYFYQSSYKNDIIIVTVKTVHNLSVNQIQIYDLNGVKFCSVSDRIIDNNSFERTVGNVTFKVCNNIVILKEIKQDLKPINPNMSSRKDKSTEVFSTYRFGTLDLETYLNNQNIPKVYAIGFYTDSEKKTYYLDKSLDSDTIIVNCLNGMLKEKYNNYTFYVHKFAKFDVTFLLSVIIKLTEDQPKIYRFEPIMRNGDIICITLWKTFYFDRVSKSGNNKYKKSYKIKLVDSYNILTNKLSDLCVTYNTKVVKGIFPYRFVTEKTLFYSGKKPPMSFYENINLEKYKQIKDKNWNTQIETIYYLERDLRSLYDIMSQFIKHISIYYNVDVTNFYTISSLAMAIYLKNFYNNNIPLVNKKSMYNDIKNSYYGGITEVYRPYGKNLYYYDVNSLYPYAALNAMAGLNSVYLSRIDKDFNDCTKDIFGFYYCKIETCKGYIRLIPTRLTDNSIYNPLGYIEGWYFSEEIKFAFENGYKIHISHGYKFDKSYDVFSEYINKIYKVKSNTTDVVERSTSKSLLNNLLGRFGMNLDKPVTSLVTSEDYQDILQTRKIVGDVKYIGNKILVTYEPSISPIICKDHEVDFRETYFNILKKTDKNLFEQEKVNSTSVPFVYKPSRDSSVVCTQQIRSRPISTQYSTRSGNISSVISSTHQSNLLKAPKIGTISSSNSCMTNKDITNKPNKFVSLNSISPLVLSEPLINDFIRPSSIMPDTKSNDNVLRMSQIRQKIIDNTNKKKINEVTTYEKKEIFLPFLSFPFLSFIFIYKRTTKTLLTFMLNVYNRLQLNNTVYE